MTTSSYTQSSRHWKSIQETLAVLKTSTQDVTPPIILSVKCCITLQFSNLIQSFAEWCLSSTRRDLMKGLVIPSRVRMNQEGWTMMNILRFFFSLWDKETKISYHMSDSQTNTSLKHTVDGTTTWSKQCCSALVKHMCARQYSELQ